MYSCGYNQFGELGIGDDDKVKGVSAEIGVLLKCKIVPESIILEQKIRFIAAGANHSLAISTK